MTPADDKTAQQLLAESVGDESARAAPPNVRAESSVARVVENLLHVGLKELRARVDGVPTLLHRGTDARRGSVNEDATEGVEVRLHGEVMGVEDSAELFGGAIAAEDGGEVVGAELG